MKPWSMQVHSWDWETGQLHPIWWDIRGFRSDTSVGHSVLQALQEEEKSTKTAFKRSTFFFVGRKKKKKRFCVWVPDCRRSPCRGGEGAGAVPGPPHRPAA